MVRSSSRSNSDRRNNLLEKQRIQSINKAYLSTNYSKVDEMLNHSRDLRQSMPTSDYQAFGTSRLSNGSNEKKRLNSTFSGQHPNIHGFRNKKMTRGAESIRDQSQPMTRDGQRETTNASGLTGSALPFINPVSRGNGPK